jgi:hypothetical protein
VDEDQIRDRFVCHFSKQSYVLIAADFSWLQYASMPDPATRRFLWFFLPVALVLVAIGGYWVSAHTPRGREKRFAKDHPLRFTRASSAGEAMLQLDACLLRYALVKDDDAYPEDLEPLGPDGIQCVTTDLSGGVSNLNYRFAYFPANLDAKGKAHGFLLYAYHLLGPDGQPSSDSTQAEYFANEDGLVLVRRDFGRATEHVEPLLGLPKTLQVLSARLLPGKPLPADQNGMLNALGTEGSPGYSSVPRGFQGLWTPADDAAAVVWTNLSEGYLYSYRPERGAAPAHFTLLARPVHMGLPGFEAPIRPQRHYFLNEAGGVHCTSQDREATAADPEISSCERTSQDCERLWITPPAGATP